jgi:hypothetical protein
MPQQEYEPRYLALDDQRPVVYKFLMPAILTSGGLLLAVSSTTRPGGVVLCSIIILIGVIQFIAVGLVQPTEECLLYKRFFKWHRVEYSDIVDCGRAAFPPFWGLHYLRLAKFQRPFGKLYFVQYHPAPLFSQRQLDHQMIEEIRARVAEKDIRSHRGDSRL